MQNDVRLPPYKSRWANLLLCVFARAAYKSTCGWQAEDSNVVDMHGMRMCCITIVWTFLFASNLSVLCSFMLSSLLTCSVDVTFCGVRTDARHRQALHQPRKLLRPECATCCERNTIWMTGTGTRPRESHRDHKLRMDETLKQQHQQLMAYALCYEWFITTTKCIWISTRKSVYDNGDGAFGNNAFLDGSERSCYGYWTITVIYLQHG